jgi:hypothetical protein
VSSLSISLQRIRELILEFGSHRAGKSYVIVEQTRGKYFYPDHDLASDGTKGEIRDLPLKETKDAKMEMILLDGTPATW